MQAGTGETGLEMRAVAPAQTFQLLNLRDELERNFEEEKGAVVTSVVPAKSMDTDHEDDEKRAAKRRAMRKKSIVDFRKLAGGKTSRKPAHAEEAVSEEDKIKDFSDKIALTFEAWMKDVVEQKARQGEKKGSTNSLTTPLMVGMPTSRAKDYTGPWCGRISDVHFKSVVKHFGHGDAGAEVLMRALVQKMNKEEIEDAVIPHSGPNTMMASPQRALDADNAIDTLKSYGTHLQAGDGKERGNINVYRLNLVDPISPVLIGRFSSTKNDELLSLDCVRAILGAGWQDIYSYYTMNQCIIAVALGGIAYTSYNLVNNDAPNIFAVGLQYAMAIKAAVELVFEELYALWRHMAFQREVLAESEDKMTCIDFAKWRLRYFVRALRLRFLDLILIYVEFEGAIAVTTSENIEKHPIRKGMFALAALAYWVRLLSGLQAYRQLGMRMLPLMHAAVDLLPVLILLLFGLGAATHMSYIAGVWTDNDHTPYTAFISMYRLGMLGNFDLRELEGATTYYKEDENGELWPYHKAVEWETNWTIHVIFLVVSVFLTVLLSNLLIGYLASNYEVYSAKAGPLFARRRAKVIVNTKSSPLYWLWRPMVELRKCCCFRKAKDGGRLHETGANSILFFAVSADPADDSEYSLRRSLMFQMSYETDKVERSMAKLETNVKHLSGKMQTVENTMAANMSEISRLLAEISDQMD